MFVGAEAGVWLRYVGSAYTYMGTGRTVGSTWASSLTLSGHNSSSCMMTEFRHDPLQQDEENEGDRGTAESARGTVTRGGPEWERATSAEK